MARKRREGESALDAFIRKYQRKRQKGVEPNDRGYDRELEEKVKRMRPEELDELLHGAEEEPD